MVESVRTVYDFKQETCPQTRGNWDLWDSWDWDWDWDTNFERSQGLGPGQKSLARLGLGHKSLGRPGTDTLWDSCPWDSNPLGLLGRPMPIPGFYCIL